MTATIYNLNKHRKNDLNVRAEALFREAGHIYESALMLALAAVDLQLTLLGYKTK